MEIKITTKQMLKVLYIISWIIFIGVCIEAGGFIFNTFFTLVINPVDAHHFWQEVDLSGLYNYDHGYFFVVALFMIIVAVMRAWLFYLIIMILHNRNLDIAQPFNRTVRLFILRGSFITLLIGLFSAWGVGYVEWLTKQGVKIPDVQYLRLGGADVWLFMCVVLFVIAQIFKRGIELQTENELTV